MNSRRFECAICGEERLSGKNRFLLAENRWEEKLTVLHWDEELVSREGMQSACSISHVEELVIHWMTTGSLDYPFARTTLGSGWRQRPDSRVDITGGRPISEPAVHRESVERLLTENPQSPFRQLERNACADIFSTLFSLPAQGGSSRLRYSALYA